MISTCFQWFTSYIHDIFLIFWICLCTANTLAENQKNLANNFNTTWDHPSSIILHFIFCIFLENIEVLGMRVMAQTQTHTNTWTLRRIYLAGLGADSVKKGKGKENIVKIVVAFEHIMQFWCPSRFRILRTIVTHYILWRKTTNLILWPLSTIPTFMTDKHSS